MAIIIGPSSPLADKQASERAVIQQVMSGALANLAGAAQSIFNKVWKNSLGLTPQQVFDSFGVDAGTLHSMLGEVSSLCNSVKAGSLNLVEPKVVTIHQDGTVTVAV